jgi:NAD(P)-dependent dehydrogenase (short-subunit alcohol dehydrogenase family)
MTIGDLSGKVSVVIGAGRGFGRAVALSLAASGSDVVLASRSSNELAETAKTIYQETGTKALAIPTDVGQRNEVDALRSAVEDAFGAVDILVNAAGIFGPVASIATADPDEWLQTLLTNTAGALFTCRAFVGWMMDRGWGRIVNVSASACFMPPATSISAYVTSKVALNQMTRHLAAEVDGTGVTANAIHPGVFKSEMWRDIRDKARANPGEAKLRDWAAWVEQSGGEPFEKGVRVVNHLIHDVPSTNGQFCWPDDSFDAPLPTW